MSAIIATPAMTIPAIAPEEREAGAEDEIIGPAIDTIASEGNPSPGLNMRVEFSA